MKKSLTTIPNSFKNIRIRLGGSQQWWADYLNLTLGQLKMAESGKRSLPTAALIKLSAIELLPPAKPATPNSKKAASDKINPFTAYIRKLELQLHRAEQTLEQMQQRYTQAIAADEVASQLLQKTGTSEEERKDSLLLEAMQLQAGRDKEKYGDTAQTLLQWKINCFVYAIAEAKKHLQSNAAQ